MTPGLSFFGSISEGLDKVLVNTMKDVENVTTRVTRLITYRHIILVRELFSADFLLVLALVLKSVSKIPALDFSSASVRRGRRTASVFSPNVTSLYCWFTVNTMSMGMSSN